MKTSEKDRLHKYFNDPTNEDEDFIASIYWDKKNEDELKKIAHEHWDKTPDAEVNLQHILEHINFYIHSNKKKLSVRDRVLGIYYRVAAVLLIPILLAGMYFHLQQSSGDIPFAEIAAPAGARVQFTLPDGSKGFLNGGSKLKYQVNFIESRKVYLNGEGYFEVMKDKEHEFIVLTKYADVKVFGTKFDVCAYDSDKTMFTTLEEGSIQVLNKMKETDTLLNPGEQNEINTQNGDMKNTNVNTKLFTSWKEEMLRFNNSTFEEVVKKIERWYGVKIILDKRLKYTENYTFTVRTESLRELLNLLSITTPMDYEIENDTVMIHPK
jgi:transmembrane sensor